MTLVDTRPLATPAEFCEYAGITEGHAAQLRYVGEGPKIRKNHRPPGPVQVERHRGVGRVAHPHPN